MPVFCCCHSQPEIIPVKLQAEELEVIKYTFPNNDPIPWKILEAPKFPPKGFHQTKGQRERFKKAIDSIKRNKSERLIWFVKDTLFNPTNFSSGNKYYHDPRIKLDTTFFNLEKKLFTIKYPKQAAKLDGLMFGNYVFASADSIRKLKKVPKRYIAISRVVFNSNHTKACYYVSYSYPEVYAGNGDMLYVEKKQGKWFLLYIKPYWTS
ncbi:hypothetical protein [Mucilaginibacter arboris]|uniref:Uncharacterized protein n=1 Tax=Mucilaginibacter arboris TaxID=2682090 RepID=A0A7K1SWG0_9SPHI|nr:hypothetical protein [Mucilaginibacter arboris]MVN21578.1 hypothetical protein [Mucilaginibacter arboris]